MEASPRLLAVLDAWCRLAREAAPETLARALLPWLFSAGFLADAAARRATARGLAAIVRACPRRCCGATAPVCGAWSGRGATLSRASPRRRSSLVAGADLLTPDGEAVAQAIPGATSAVVPRRRTRRRARGAATR